MGKITTAIIPVAGYGTRRLPITKTIEKCMLPIGNRPIVDYVVEDCMKAGITDIWFVVSENSTQIHQYFGHNRRLEKYLRSKDKTAELAQIQPPTTVNFHYIKQSPYGKYGTTIPVALALKEIGVNESVLVVMGDDFFYHAPGDESSQLSDLVAAAGIGEASVLGFQVASREEASKYGVIEQDVNGNFVKIWENPKPEDAPSLLINLAKYVITPRLAELITAHATDEDGAAPGGEYQILRPIDDFVSTGGVMRVVSATGQYLDGGNLAGWLYANDVVGKNLLKNP
jgi:UTP--glucose-1-phosphate uridylyltransferase